MLTCDDNKYANFPAATRRPCLRGVLISRYWVATFFLCAALPDWSSLHLSLTVVLLLLRTVQSCFGDDARCMLFRDIKGRTISGNILAYF